MVAFKELPYGVDIESAPYLPQYFDEHEWSKLL